nr:hypothetical protein [Tanacetum cinerariifolium]
MLAPGRYPQWRSRFLRYVDTRPNGDALRKCILSGTYKPIIVLVQAVVATDDSLAIREHTTVKTPMNMSPENKAHFQAQKKAIHLILTAIGDEIYSTVDACQKAQEMWEAIKRFYKLMNEMIRNNLTVAIMQANVQFLQQLQPEWSRLARNTNPLALVATAQANQDPYYQTSKSHKSHAPSSKPLAVKDSAYHKEKMLLCKQAEQGVSLQAEQYDWLADTDEEINEQELEAHYSYMSKIQEVPTADSGTNSEPLEQVQNNAGYNVFANDLQHSEQSKSVSNTCLVETDDSNVIPDSPDMCDDDIQNDQNDVESDDERVALANLNDNLKLDVDEDKKIQKKLKKANTTLSQELKECKTILAETSKTLGESNSVQDSCLVALQNKQTEFEKYKDFNDRTVDYDKLKQTSITLGESNSVQDSSLVALQNKQTEFEKYKDFNDRTVDYDKLKRKLNETLGQLAQKDIEIKEDALAELQCLYLHKVKECDCLAQKLSKQTESVSKEVHNELLQRFAKVEKHSISLEIALQKCEEQVKNDTVWNKKHQMSFE